MSNPKCPVCNKEMSNTKDSRTKKISKYLWVCNCKGMKGLILSRG